MSSSRKASRKTRGREREKTRARVSLRGHALWRYMHSELFWLLLICLAAAAVLAFTRNRPTYGSETAPEEDAMLFVGDVMLARHVETLMDTEGTYYPFKGVRDMLKEYEAVVGNFEASIPEHHAHTPGFAFRFSVDKRVVEALPRVGFTHMTLANNHAYDYGEKGYAHTRDTLTAAGLEIAGNPKKNSPDEVLYRTVGDVETAIIPINTIGETPKLSEIQNALAAAAEKSDVQIVSLHWGVEYKATANDAQQALAHALIDAGADAIIGSHPHVVQNVEEYRGVPIFYSLGNFIFDQYWNAAVQEGLTVAISFSDDEIRYTLLPVSSIDTRSAPRPMNRVERVAFLNALAERSEETLADAIKEGVVVEPFARRADTLVD